MLQTVEIELAEAKASYSAWLNIVLKRFGGKKANVFNAVKTKAITLAGGSRLNLPSEVADFTATNVSNWFDPKRQSIPAESHRLINEALLQVALEITSDIPKVELPVLSFSESIAALRRIRGLRQKSGKSLLVNAQQLMELEALVTPFAKARDLNGDDLFLGSWVTNGGIPNYVTRKLDEEIIDSLNGNGKELVVLVGDPKAGKTRSLLEALKKSNSKDSEVFWLQPKRGVLELAIKSISPARKNNTVIVLDDLQRFSFAVDDGLTDKKLSQLIERGRVVATLHRSQLDRWNESLINHSSFVGQGDLEFSDAFHGDTRYSPSRRVLERIRDGLIEVPSILDSEEVSSAEKVLGDFVADGTDLKFLASYLSSVDFLEAKAKRFLSGTPLEICTMKALIDSNFAYPLGASLDQLRQLSNANLLKLKSNSPWVENKWIACISALSTGVNAGSPHSILMKTTDEPELFTIMDAVWEKVVPSVWDAEHLSFLEDDAKYTLGVNAYEFGFEDASKKVLSELVEKGHLDATSFLAYIEYSSKDFEKAKLLFEVGAKLNDIYSINSLGIIFRELGDLESSEFWHRIAVEKGDAEAMMRLGYLFEMRDMIDDAEDWYRRSAQLGYAKGMASLGLILKKVSNFKESDFWLEKAAALGDEYSMVHLGRSLIERGDGSGLRYLENGASAGNLYAFFYLGSYYLEQEDFKTARGWLEPAADLGFIFAVNEMGWSYYLQKNYEVAKLWFERGVAEENVFSTHMLGICYEELGLLELAEEVFRTNSNRGDADSTVRLGYVLYLQGQRVDAKATWLLEAKEGNAEAMGFIGELEIEDGDSELGISWLEKSAKLGDEQAIKLLKKIRSKNKASKKDSDFSPQKKMQNRNVSERTSLITKTKSKKSPI